MELEQDIVEGHLVLSLEGILDATEVQITRGDLEELIDEATGNIILDLSELESVDSSGIGLLVYLYKRASNRKLRLMLVGLHGQPGDMLRFLKIDKTIPNYGKVSDAILAGDSPRRL